MIRASAGLAALVACSGDEPPLDHTAATHSATTPTPFDGFEPTGFGVLWAQFAVDTDGRAGGWTNAQGDRVPATLALTLVDSTWSSGATDDNHCELTWTWWDPIAAESSPQTPAFARWNPSEAPGARLTETCGALVFPDRWGGDPAGIAASWGWGTGVGPLDQGVRAALEQSFGDDFETYEPFIAGGGFWWDGLRDRENLNVPDEWRKGWVDTGVVYAFELDTEGREVLVGGVPVQLLAADLPTADGIVAARYEVQGTTVLTPADALFPTEE